MKIKKYIYAHQLEAKVSLSIPPFSTLTSAAFVSIP